MSEYAEKEVIYISKSNTIAEISYVIYFCDLIVMDRKAYYRNLRWNKSPFIKSTSLDTPIVRRYEEFKLIEECIGGWDRIMIVTAPIGYGKTTLMNLLVKEKPRGVDYVVPFDAYEPIDAVMKKIIKTLPPWKRLFVGNIDRTEFGTFLQKKLGSQKMLLLFDEAQDYEDELFRWLRIINDRANNVFMIFFGLPKLESRITAETSFRDRKSKTIQMRPLSDEELRNIVVERIHWVSGDGIRPFTEGGLKRLCESANSVPRKLLENGQGVVEEGARRDNLSIDETFVEGVLGFFEDPATVVDDKKEPQITVPVNVIPTSGFLEDLSPTQKNIVDLLMTNEDLSISELSETLGSGIRSVGSLIRKLRGLDKDEVLRKPNVPYPIVVRKGKEKRMGRFQYVYTLSDNVRRLIAQK